VDPQIDRSLKRAEQRLKDVLLRCTASDDRGIVVSGVKTIATSAAISDEVVVWPLPVPQSEEEREYASRVLGFNEFAGSEDDLPRLVLSSAGCNC